MINYPLILSIISLVPLIISQIEANNSSNCIQTCGPNKTEVHYPFGFSSSCPIPLNCSDTGHVSIRGFPIDKFNNGSIVVSLPAKCNRSVESILPLFGDNYAMTWQNSLMFQNCPGTVPGCMIPRAMVEERVGASGCDSGGGNFSCYSGEGHNGYLRYADVAGLGCGILFSAVVDESVAGGDNSTLSLKFQVAELKWWMDGECDCSKNAECLAVTKPSGRRGYRCQCRDGFEGDGFAQGGGCYKGPGCSASRYLSDKCGGGTRVGVLVGGIIAGAVLMAIIVLICCCIRRRSISLKSQMSAKRLLWEAAGDSSVPLYPYKDISRATNSFSNDQKLGNGAYGTVYAGKLHNDKLVAIKKIKHQDNNGIEQVMNEIKLLSSVSHPNLVRLLGCCIENDEQILVYEYMPNGTLSQHLHRERGCVLPWTVRLAIATETANAISYLHSAMNPPIYHRDIKSSNILLDYNFNSKVADFGLSRLGITDDSHISTAPQGTPGYVDPEYHQNFYLSDKSDVYSFGVVLLEIISALKVVDFSRPHSEVNLAALAIEKIGKGRLDEIIDPGIDQNKDPWVVSSIHKVAELAFRCLAFHRDMRPSMPEVAEELEMIRLSGWVPGGDEIKSVSLSPGSLFKKSGVDSRRLLLVPQRPIDCMIPLEEVEEGSPVSVQDPWHSEQSSPSATSLLSNPV